MHDERLDSELKRLKTDWRLLNSHTLKASPQGHYICPQQIINSLRSS